MKNATEETEEKIMKTTVGLWIDHRKAVIVFVEGKEEEIKLISSKEEKQHRQSGVSKSADDIRQRELTGHLNSYYDEVISCIRDAESILIFGPGEAKGELKNRLEKENLGERIVGIEPADKMTDPQIVAQVQERFPNRRAAASSS
jgi:stalled ribosome rescue protein Dom34